MTVSQPAMTPGVAVTINANSLGSKFSNANRNIFFFTYLFYLSTVIVQWHRFRDAIDLVMIVTL